MDQVQLMLRAIALSTEAMQHGGGPFGAVVAKDGRIVAEGHNRVTSTKDPTAHAEVVAIREACSVLGSYSLHGCEIYCSCEPCPMCLAAIYWARLDRIYYANTRDDAARVGFDDAFLYHELGREGAERTIPMVRLLGKEAIAAFQAWEEKPDKIAY
ncbi:MAG: guanine deaminase [Gemmatimonas sp. SG8_17]|nr:MAG: guanine deaminase [Gemmatimonas sp. SG8_17]